MKKMRRILKKVGRTEIKEDEIAQTEVSMVGKARSTRFIADMLSMTHGCGDPGFSGRGKKFIGDISTNGGDEGDID